MVKTVKVRQSKTNAGRSPTPNLHCFCASWRTFVVSVKTSYCWPLWFYVKPPRWAEVLKSFPFHLRGVSFGVLNRDRLWLMVVQSPPVVGTFLKGAMAAFPGPSQSCLKRNFHFGPYHGLHQATRQRQQLCTEAQRTEAFKKDNCVPIFCSVWVCLHSKFSKQRRVFLRRDSDCGFKPRCALRRKGFKD